MGDWTPLAVVAGVAILALPVMRVIAARRIARRDTRLIWFLFPIQFLGGFSLVAIAVSMLQRLPIAAAAIGAAGALMLALATRLVLRLRRSIDSAPASADISGVITDLAAEDMVKMVGVMVLVGIVGGVLLLILAVTHAL